MAVRKETVAKNREEWLSGQVRADEILAEAVIINGRKAWYCRFCSETNVWTRWRCRRCHTSILSGFKGKVQGSLSKSWRMFFRILLFKWRRESKKYWDPVAEVRDLREELKRYRNAEKKRDGRCRASLQVKKTEYRRR